MTHTHEQWWGGRPEGVGGAGWRGAKGENQDNCIISKYIIFTTCPIVRIIKNLNIKNKFNKRCARALIKNYKAMPTEVKENFIK